MFQSQPTSSQLSSQVPVEGEICLDQPVSGTLPDFEHPQAQAGGAGGWLSTERGHGWRWEGTPPPTGPKGPPCPIIPTLFMALTFGEEKNPREP